MAFFQKGQVHCLAKVRKVPVSVFLILRKAGKALDPSY